MADWVLCKKIDIKEKRASEMSNWPPVRTHARRRRRRHRHRRSHSRRLLIKYDGFCFVYYSELSVIVCLRFFEKRRFIIAAISRSA